MEQKTPEKKLNYSVKSSPSVSDGWQDQKRRSSSRSIKRKRFDDEIVEYSLGTPPAQFNRIARYRTLSQTNIHGIESAESAATPESEQPQIPTSTAVANTSSANLTSTKNPSASPAHSLSAPSASIAVTSISTTATIAVPTSSVAPLLSPMTSQIPRKKSESKDDSQTVKVNSNRNRVQNDTAVTNSSYARDGNSGSKAKDIARVGETISISSTFNNKNKEYKIQRRRNSVFITSIRNNKDNSNAQKDNNKESSVARSDNSAYQSDSSTKAIRKQSESNQIDNSNNNRNNTVQNNTNNIDSKTINSNSQNNVNNSSNTGSATHDKRRTLKSVSTSKKSKKNRMAQQMTTKDLGRWKPIDDLSLIVGIQQTNDLRIVHRGVKFSCKFTIQEMQNRWYSLLYDEPISRIAVAAMRNLHPELVAGVHNRALFTTQEEELLGTIKSTDSPTLEIFQMLLNKNALNFYPARTAKGLMSHWNLMKQYMLLPDQAVNSNLKNPKLFSSLPDGDCNINFSDQEDKINDSDLTEPRDEALELELALADRKHKKEIRHLENELPRWTVLVDSITGIGNHPEFDNQTLAVLRGRLVRYLMRSREITLGRKSKHEVVDVDLNLEGPAYKVSRRQGTIKLRSNGDFFIANEGKRPMFVDGMPLLQGNKAKLNNNCTIEVSGLRLVFLVNTELVNAIRQESAKMNGPLN